MYPPFLSVESIYYDYSNRETLQDISFSLDEGEILGIIGKNGSGKTTLLKCINRLLIPKSGKIIFDGKDTSNLKSRDIAKIFGYVPQKNHFETSFSSFDVVMMGRNPHSFWGNKEDNRIVESVISEIGISNLSSRCFSELSGGEMQKVLIARAIAQESKILLLDEPTNNLDICQQLDIINTLKRLVKSRGSSMCVVVHDLSTSLKHCDKTLILELGKKMEFGPSHEVLTKEKIKSFFDVDVEIYKNNVIID